MKIILPNQEIIVKYIEENKVSFEGQKGIVKNLPNDIKNNSFLKVRITKIDPMRGFEAIFLSIATNNNSNINSTNNFNNNTNNNYNKNNDYNKNNFNKNNNREQKNNLIEKRLNEITEGNVGESFTIKVKILEIKQTKGPTIFVVYDGSRISIAKGFEKAGERAFPQINVGDKIKAEVKVSMFDNSVELSIKGYEFLSIKEDEELIKNIELETEKKVKVNDWNFLIESETLKKMKPDFEKFAKIINHAIVDNKPIYLKHHADCDGLSAAMALERAILKKMYEVYGDEMVIKHNYKRSLSKSPFYDYFDASRDTAMFLEDAAYFGTKAPLIIVVDFGSSTESLLSYKKLKSNGAQIIVLDHHQIETQEKEILLDYVDIIVNSTLYGVDYDFSAGMLATEISHFISDDVNIDYLAAISGTGDRIQSIELEKYMEIANKSGYSKEYILKLVEVIDFEIYNLKFMEARDFYDSLLTKTKEQEEMIDIIYEEIQKKKDIVLKTIIHKKEVIQKENKTLIKLNLEKDFKREYPTSGRIVGMCSDYYKEHYDKFLCIGFDYDLVVIRAKENSNFDIHELIDILYEKLEYAQIDGGGHKLVGSLKFIPSALNDVIRIVEDYFFNKVE